MHPSSMPGVATSGCRRGSAPGCTASCRADAGLSLGDFDVLVALSEAPGQRLRAFELAAVLEWEKSRLSHHVRRMEQRGARLARGR